MHTELVVEMKTELIPPVPVPRGISSWGRDVCLAVVVGLVLLMGRELPFVAVNASRTMSLRTLEESFFLRAPVSERIDSVE